jgi:hypothetical protein
MKEMKKIKIIFLPKTCLGKWSVILTIVSFILFVVGSVFPVEVKSYSGFGIFTQNPLLTIITILLFVVSIATSIMGLISVIKNKERSILVFFAILSVFFYILSFFGSIVYVFFKLNP